MGITIANAYIGNNAGIWETILTFVNITVIEIRASLWFFDLFGFYCPDNRRCNVTL